MVTIKENYRVLEVKQNDSLVIITLGHADYYKRDYYLSLKNYEILTPLLQGDNIEVTLDIDLSDSKGSYSKTKLVGYTVIKK